MGTVKTLLLKGSLGLGCLIMASGCGRVPDELSNLNAETWGVFKEIVFSPADGVVTYDQGGGTHWVDGRNFVFVSAAEARAFKRDASGTKFRFEVNFDFATTSYRSGSYNYIHSEIEIMCDGSPIPITFKNNREKHDDHHMHSKAMWTSDERTGSNMFGAYSLRFKAIGGSRPEIKRIRAVVYQAY